MLQAEHNVPLNALIKSVKIDCKFGFRGLSLRGKLSKGKPGKGISGATEFLVPFRGPVTLARNGTLGTIWLTVKVPVASL